MSENQVTAGNPTPKKVHSIERYAFQIMIFGTMVILFFHLFAIVNIDNGIRLGLAINIAGIIIYVCFGENQPHNTFKAVLKPIAIDDLCPDCKRHLISKYPVRHVLIDGKRGAGKTSSTMEESDENNI